MAKGYTDTQLQYMAHGVASGLDPAHICESAGLTRHMYDKLLARTEVDTHQLAVYDTHLARASARTALVTLRHRAEMDQMVPAAYAAINHSVSDYVANPELASRMAKWILQQAAGAALVEETTGHGNQANTQVNIYAGEKSREAVLGFIDSVQKTTSELMQTPLPHINEPSRHVTVSEAEVVQLHPAEKSDASDPLNEGEV